MFVFKDREQKLLAWNTVEALVDGQLQHGNVVDVAEGGLMVEFGCGTQRAQLIEYGRIRRIFPDFRSQPPTLRTTTTEVLVLLRHDPDDAWIWYPGKRIPLGDCWYNFLDLVEVQRPHGIVREIVPHTQVRLTPTDEDVKRRLVREGDFVVRSCPLPAGYWADGSQLPREIFKSELNQRWRVVCTSVLSQTFDYLQRQTDKPVTHEILNLAYKAATEEARARISCRCLRLLRQMTVRTSSRKRKTDGGSRTSLPLPAELMVEVFQSLDSIGRFRCRRVCHLWNTVLTTDAYFPDVRVSGSDTEYGDLQCTYAMGYWVVAGLLKCLSNATKV
ncbi:uncharacterized protein LOC129599082 [Paramacrobiotus metropolitanus]|uniref:uncharacterized protein LOC129599082 n=1 Tax=Paramacrobiotus metropolitanus TaxID=2943436 RepID=UPI002445D32F|nr:uncharacterized protein LOC129599082 [Paramacrobiotus metropolitanus]